MSRITLDMIRKKSEHHDGLLSELQEISLHQLNLDKIELLGNVCNRLQILYLQNNLIPRIENLKRLKDLNYLNLAVNNIRKIEGLEGCEKLKKLDLMLNFIDLPDLLSGLQALQRNEFLTELYLKGNPCDKWSGYRELVITQLPGLATLDGHEVTRTERIQAEKNLPKLLESLGLAVAVIAAERKSKEGEPVDENKYTPELRVQMHRDREDKKRKDDEARKESSVFKEHKNLWAESQKKLNQKAVPPADGSRPLQRNQSKMGYTIKGSDDPLAEFVVATVHGVPRFLDTSAIDVDVHPTWFQVLIKEQLLLLHFDKEVSPDRTKVQRNTSTGDLILTMPVTEACLSAAKATRVTTAPKTENQNRHVLGDLLPSEGKSGRAQAAVAESAPTRGQAIPLVAAAPESSATSAQSLALEEDIDDSDVPPLE